MLFLVLDPQMTSQYSQFVVRHFRIGRRRASFPSDWRLYLGHLHCCLCPSQYRGSVEFFYMALT